MRIAGRLNHWHLNTNGSHFMRLGELNGQNVKVRMTISKKIAGHGYNWIAYNSWNGGKVIDQETFHSLLEAKKRRPDVRFINLPKRSKCVKVAKAKPPKQAEFDFALMNEKMDKMDTTLDAIVKKIGVRV